MNFGLPPGSLKDVKDEKAALEVVRDFTDKVLTAGLGFAPTQLEEKPVAKPAETPKEPAKAASEKPNDELAALRAELAEIKGSLTKQTQQTQQQAIAELNRRIDAKIDSWASSKYGVASNRNYKQTKAVKDFKDSLIPNLLAGRQAAGLPIDATIEVYMEQLRVYDDESYVPPRKGADKNATVGAPGTTKKTAGGDAPRNIHEALQKFSM